MKRWKLLAGLAIIVLMSIAATTPPYFARSTVNEEQLIAVDSAGDSTIWGDTINFKVGGYNYLRYYVVVTEDDDSLPGQGLSDSIAMSLQFLRDGVWVTWDTAYGTVVTDTLAGIILKADGDTLLAEHARILIWLADTTSDTTATMEFDLSVELFGKVSP